MKLNKEIVIALIIMIATSALYRVLPGRPYGFAPQIAIALFSGSLFIKNKHFAFLLPLISMFLSDLLYQVLYVNHLSPIQGFYDGQWQNYLLIAATAIFGFGLTPAQRPRSSFACPSGRPDIAAETEVGFVKASARSKKSTNWLDEIILSMISF